MFKTTAAPERWPAILLLFILLASLLILLPAPKTKKAMLKNPPIRSSLAAPKSSQKSENRGQSPANVNGFPAVDKSQAAGDGSPKAAVPISEPKSVPPHREAPPRNEGSQTLTVQQMLRYPKKRDILFKSRKEATELAFY